MNYKADYLKNICAKFLIEGEFVNSKPYGSGHINDTYAVTFRQASNTKRYILQRINNTIFTDVPGLMNNIVRVTKHIRDKLEKQKADDIARKVLTVVSTAKGNSYYGDTDGNFWRMYIFIEKARTYDVPESLEQIYEAARAFGNFQQMLIDLPQPALIETIPDFHNALKRLEVFKNVLNADVCNRAKDIKEEVEFLHKNEQIFYTLSGLIKTGQIRIRITHNDTKVNNVLMDGDTGRGICVIDLDTVMPGLSLYDFGDIIRTSISSAAEDERNLSKVMMEMPRFEAVLKGYLASAGKFLNKTELENLILGSKYITLVIGMRFLTDYLNGDKYFKIHREGHNLDRCRTQFKLVDSINKQEDEMMLLVKENYYAG
ncbi:MAG: aminoglycoside phosphotransferase family protein [Phycisphaerae bacterium]|nr:aminoglycoside phosphotransferase family protein [Phycisphaerae bacterium]